MRSEPSKTNDSKVQQLLDLTRPYRLQLTLIAAASVAGGVAEALLLVLLARIGLAVADNEAVAVSVRGVSLSMASAFLVAALLLLCRLACALWSAERSAALVTEVSEATKTDLASSYIDSAWTTQQDQPSGKLVQLVTSVSNVAVGAISSTANSISSACSLAALMAFSAIVDLKATLLVGSTLALLATALRPLKRRIRLRSGLAATATMRFGNEVSELGSLSLEMQVFGLQSEFKRTIEELAASEGQLHKRARALQSWLPQLYLAMAFSALLSSLAIARSMGPAVVTTLGSVVLVMLRSLSYGQQLQSASGGLLASLPSLDQIAEARESFEANTAPGGSRSIGEFARMDLRSVSLVLNRSRPVLDGVSLSIEAGEVVGMVGSSGAGKTSLLTLLLGLREPSSGTVMVNGHDLRGIDRTEWSRTVSFVPQSPMMRTGSVLDNIVFFREGISLEQVAQAAGRAAVLEEILAFPDGFNTQIGQQGVQISGGQRQRLAIARALVKHPNLLIMDEPTSALDAHSEMALVRTIEELRGRITVVVAAHRSSTLAICSRILKVTDGSVVEVDPGQLINTRPKVLESEVSNHEMTTEES